MCLTTWNRFRRTNYKSLDYATCKKPGAIHIIDYCVVKGNYTVSSHREP